MELQIGTIISRARHAKGMTQEMLADAVGVSAAAVSKWETGASYPDITLLSPLARALGLTVDRLLDFREHPTDDEIHALTERLGKVFDEQGYAAGQAACEQVLREYPTCGSLKLVIGSLYYRYLSFALNGKTDPGEVMSGLTEQTLALFEQGEAECTKPDDAQLAKALRISALIMLSRFDEAEALLDSLPKRPLISRPEQLYQTLYLARGDLDKAEEVNQRALFEQVCEAGTTLMNLAAVARRREDRAAAWRFTDAYSALSELFELDPLGSIQLKLILAAQQDRDDALSLFEQYVDAALSRTMDYTQNPFFSLVQTRVPTRNELDSMNRLLLRAAEEEDDQVFSRLRGEKRFQAALERLRASLPPE